MSAVLAYMITAAAIITVLALAVPIIAVLLLYREKTLYGDTTNIFDQLERGEMHARKMISDQAHRWPSEWEERY